MIEKCNKNVHPTDSKNVRVDDLEKLRAVAEAAAEPRADCESCGGNGSYSVSAGDYEWGEDCENCDNDPNSRAEYAAAAKPSTVLALLDRIGELEQRVKDAAWEYEKQLNRLFKKELYCRARLETVTAQKEAWREAAEALDSILDIAEFDFKGDSVSFNRIRVADNERAFSALDAASALDPEDCE